MPGFCMSISESREGASKPRLTGPVADQLMCEVLRTVHAKNESDEVRTHHQQDIGDTTSRTRMAIPPPFRKLQQKARDKVRRGPSSTLEGNEELKGRHTHQ